MFVKYLENACKPLFLKGLQIISTNELESFSRIGH